MPLTPSMNDKNRDAEMKRREFDPDSFNNNPLRKETEKLRQSKLGLQTPNTNTVDQVNKSKGK